MANIPLALGAPLTRGAVVDAAVAFLAGPPPASMAVEQWGVFDQDGNLVLEPDSVTGVDFGKDYQVSSYPQEQGAFQSYNRVEEPAEPRLMMVIGGSTARREAFLAACKALQDSDDTYQVITPDVTYPSVSLTRYEYSRRADRGRSLIAVELHFIEVRVTATAAFSQTVVQNPASATPASNGTVQAGPPMPTPAPTT